MDRGRCVVGREGIDRESHKVGQREAERDRKYKNSGDRLNKDRQTEKEGGKTC